MRGDVGGGEFDMTDGLRGGAQVVPNLMRSSPTDGEDSYRRVYVRP